MWTSPQQLRYDLGKLSLLLALSIILFIFSENSTTLVSFVLITQLINHGEKGGEGTSHHSYLIFKAGNVKSVGFLLPEYITSSVGLDWAWILNIESSVFKYVCSQNRLDNHTYLSNKWIVTHVANSRYVLSKKNVRGEHFCQTITLTKYLLRLI